jgi:hypothetical protein
MVKVRPSRLTIYHPQLNISELFNELSLSLVESKYPKCVILLGDFNKLNVAKIKSSFRLKQIVDFPTRGQSALPLDLILTNLQN